MSADRITYEKQEGFFIIDNQSGYSTLSEHHGVLAVCELPNSGGEYNNFTPAELGKIVATALMQGVSRVRFDSVTLTVNYLVQMLRFSGRHGWFSDLLSSTTDHEFDGNIPTPGLFVGEARAQFAEAAELEQYALMARAAYHFDEADNAESKANELRRTAREKLTRQ